MRLAEINDELGAARTGKKSFYSYPVLKQNAKNTEKYSE